MTKQKNGDRLVDEAAGQTKRGATRRTNSFIAGLLFVTKVGAGAFAGLTITAIILILALANFEQAHRMRGTRNIGSFSTIS